MFHYAILGSIMPTVPLECPPQHLLLAHAFMIVFKSSPANTISCTFVLAYYLL